MDGKALALVMAKVLFVCNRSLFSLSFSILTLMGREYWADMHDSYAEINAVGFSDLFMKSD